MFLEQSGGSSSLRDALPRIWAGAAAGNRPSTVVLASGFGQGLKVKFREKKTVCIFWRRLISRLQIEFPSNSIRVYFYSGIKSGWNRTQWNMLILTEFCTLNIFKAKNSKQSLSKDHTTRELGKVFVLLQGECHWKLRAFTGVGESSTGPTQDLRGWSRGREVNMAYCKSAIWCFYKNVLFDYHWH